MNVLNIQKDVLKDALSEKDVNRRKWIIKVTPKEVLVTEGHVVFSLPIKDWLLDVDALYKAGCRASDGLVTIMDGHVKASPADKTGLIKVLKINGGDKEALELKCGESLIYVDPKLLKNFDKSVEFEATLPNAPVYLYEDDILVGVVMPIKAR